MNSPKNSLVRPTTDKLRAALFSILDSKTEGAHVLDAFAGTGAFGIEAYSRGAEYIAFIDTDTVTLKQNVALMDKSKYSVRKANFFTTTKQLVEKFDIIFIDPPYGTYRAEDILAEIATYNLLKENGIIIYEEFYKTVFPHETAFELYDERRYGDTAVRFYK